MKHWGKILRLRPVEVALLPAILVLLAATRLALSIMPFSWLRRTLDGLKRLRVRWLAGLSREQATWMIKAAARYVPGATCLTQAIAAELLHALRGEIAHTRLGVARAGRRLEAHAWLELGGQVMLGVSEPGKFTTLVRYR